MAEVDGQKQPVVRKQWWKTDPSGQVTLIHVKADAATAE
jgi:hypothetical protein